MYIRHSIKSRNHTLEHDETHQSYCTLLSLLILFPYAIKKTARLLQRGLLVFTAVSIGRIYHFVKYLYYLIYYLYELKIFLYREEVLRELQASSHTAHLKSCHMCSPPHPKREKECEAGAAAPASHSFSLLGWGGEHM